MSLKETSNQDWADCKPGTLAEYAVREQSRIKVRRIRQTVGIASVAVVAVFVLMTVLPHIGTLLEPNYGGIVCSKVKASATSYLAGTLDQDTKSKIELHLKSCSKCIAWMKQLRSAQALQVDLKSYRQRYISAINWQASEP